MRLTELIYGVCYSLVVLINGEMIMKNANEPAMPIEFNGFGQHAPEAHSGLTKREMFAMHAMQGLLSADYQNGSEKLNSEDVASMSIDYADALLAELEK